MIFQDLTPNHWSLCGSDLEAVPAAGESAASYPRGLDPADLPSYLSHPWKGYWEEEHPRIKLAWLVDTAEFCVRWAVALAELVHAHGGALPADVTALIRDHVERPTLGRWLAVLRALCEAKPREPLLVPGVFRIAAEVIDREFSSAGTAETSLLVLRNEVAHAGGLSWTGAALSPLTSSMIGGRLSVLSRDGRYEEEKTQPKGD